MPPLRPALLLAALAILSPGVGAQTWTLQSPHPADVSLLSVQFVDATTGFVTGEDHILMRTLDGGTTWEQAPGILRDPLFLENPYNRVFFLDSLRGWVIGNNNDAWRTTDGGNTWIQMSAFPAGSYYYLEFVDAMTGWAGGNGSIVRTRDSGLSWEVLTWYDEHGNVYGMDFLDTQTGVFVNDPIFNWPEGVWLTQDGGNTWTLLQQGAFNEVVFLDAQTILAPSGHTVWRSDDLGQTWQTFATWLGQGVSRLAVLDPDTVLAVDWGGSVFLSGDRGVTWSQVFEGPGSPPDDWDIRFRDAQNGWICGAGGWVFESRDGGWTWEQRNQGLAVPWADIQMLPSGTGIAVGTQGNLTWTTDFGANWSTQRLQVTGATLFRDEDLNTAFLLHDQTAFAAGDDGVVYRTDDGGATWQSIGYPALPEAWIHYIGFADAQTGWIVGQAEAGLNAFLWHTTDGGQTWVNQDPGLGALYGGWVVDPDTMWVVGSGDFAWKTEDGGQNWLPYPLPSLSSTPYTRIAFDRANPDTGWAIAYQTLIHTENGGNTWSVQQLPGLPPNETPLDIAIVDESHAWISTGAEGLVYTTADGGQTWTQVDHGIDSPWLLGLAGISALDTSRAWAAGAQGVILTSEGGSPPDLVLATPVLQRGLTSDLEVTQAQAGETIWFLYSLTGLGIGPSVGPLGGLTLDILAPVQIAGSAPAGATGRSVLSIPVPSTAPLIDIFLQAVAARGPGGADSVKSNTATSTILP